MKLHQLFGLKNQAKTAASASAPESEGSMPPEETSANAVRQQLIQVLLRDTARRAGIPSHWLDCQMLLTSSRAHGEGMYVRIIMKHWDLRMLTYAAAFQKALMADIMRFEPRASEWLHGISWQLDGGESCPHQDLPDPTSWMHNPARPRGGYTPRQPAEQATPAPLAQAQSPAHH
ncbi:MAG: hypothetical protein ABI893_01115 [Polaromonas sp.]|uniref:hypothetical protein n=1 Tax=Polaromonas sp. TaxID=1869339 RepID=UPI003262F139